MWTGSHGQNSAKLLSNNSIFWALGSIMLVVVGVAIWQEAWLLLTLPILAGFVALTLLEWRWLYALMFWSIPFSVETTIGSIHTDFPTEFMILGLCLCWVLTQVIHVRTIDARPIYHPITLALLAHVAWIAVATVDSQQLLYSAKYLAAKGWSITAFFAIPILLFSDRKFLERLFQGLLVSLMITVGIVLMKQANYGFSFEKVNKAMMPFFRNHVAYASIMVLLLPFIWFGRYTYKKHSFWWWMFALSIPVLLVAIQLSYTRAAMASILVAIGGYYIVKWRLVRPVFFAGMLGALLLVTWVLRDDNYMLFAPDYERTISHHNFDNLLEATTKLEDISTMERVYRWVAAFRMADEHPITGFGPANFYSFYEPYTLNTFQTYVSDNPEKSGVHNYLLMLLVEQGYIGLFFFLLLVATILFQGEKLYHQVNDAYRKRWIMAAMLSFIVNITIELINDMVETTKAGSFFFISAAIIVVMAYYGKREEV